MKSIEIVGNYQKKIQASQPSLTKKGLELTDKGKSNSFEVKKTNSQDIETSQSTSPGKLINIRV
jgi:hypothetical protein